MNTRVRGATVIAAAVLYLSLTAGPRPASSWGTPHTEITRHALRQLPASDRLETRLGGVRQMEDLAWGADYRGDVHARYYVDDYLLFPGFPRHSSHLMPEVAETWKPYFLRTLQALRGESPPNAARWLGSLLHFVEDTGSPPHALPTGGVLHTRMENYVLALDVRLSGYRPQEWGEDESATLEALDRRMKALVAFSRQRAERLLPLAEKNDRLACEPLVLECAQETMRAVADVTHALMVLSRKGPRPARGTLRGSVSAPAMPAFPLAPTKVLVEGTDFSTIADALPSIPGDRTYRAEWVLGDLPPGSYTVTLLRTGCRTASRKLTVRSGKTVTWRAQLKPDGPAGNLIRNPDLSVRWLRPGSPDHWTRSGGEWRADPVRVEPGKVYQVEARDASGPRRVYLRVSDDPRMPASAQRIEVPAAGRVVLPLPFAQLIVPGEDPPAHAFIRPVDTITEPLKGAKRPGESR